MAPGGFVRMRSRRSTHPAEKVRDPISKSVVSHLTITFAVRSVAITGQTGRTVIASHGENRLRITNTKGDPRGFGIHYPCQCLATAPYSKLAERRSLTRDGNFANTKFQGTIRTLGSNSPFVSRSYRATGPGNNLGRFLRLTPRCPPRNAALGNHSTAWIFDCGYLGANNWGQIKSLTTSQIRPHKRVSKGDPGGGYPQKL